MCLSQGTHPPTHSLTHLLYVCKTRQFLDPTHRLRHTLLPRAFYCLGTLCIVTFCSKEQFASNWLVTVCFLTHFASQELNTLGSPTHFAKSRFTPQHTLLLNTLCHSAPIAPVLNTPLRSDKISKNCSVI